MERYPVHQDEVLQHFLRKIEGPVGSHLKAVVLYGPRLKAVNRDNTEYNILAILDEVSPSVRETIAAIADHMAMYHHVPFSVVAFSEEEQRQKVQKPYWRKVRQEGVVVWPRQ
jgi:hypothetical protein